MDNVLPLFSDFFKKIININQTSLKLTAKLYGILNPTPIFSPNNMLVIHFKSDGENRFQGFKARFTFLLSGE